MPTTTIIQIISVLTLVAQIAIFGGIIYFLFSRNHYNNPIIKFFLDNGILFAFLIALVSMLGSLYFSEIARLEPCELCWFQRIFMYPQVIITCMYITETIFPLQAASGSLSHAVRRSATI